jgi:hypothetical protein
MSNWPEISRYSKRSVFVSVPGDIEVLAWADEVIHRLGGVKGMSEGEKGWILPRNQEINFCTQYRLFKESKPNVPNQRVRRSRNPDKKRKRSRVAVRASEHSSFNESYNPENIDKRAGSDNLDDSKKETEKKLVKSKPISYINWEKPSGKEEEKLSEEENREEEGEESDNEKEESDEESSDDEMIQAVLARKMKNESSGKVIDSETINDSDEEDCVSHSRRFRHIYALLESLRSRMTELEGKLPKSS